MDNEDEKTDIDHKEDEQPREKTQDETEIVFN